MSQSCQLLTAGQRLGADDDACDTQLCQALRIAGYRQARVDPQLEPKAGQCTDQLTMAASARNGVEVGHVAVPAAKHIAVGDRKRTRIAAAAKQAGNRRIARALATHGMDGQPAFEIEHRNNMHSTILAEKVEAPLIGWDIGGANLKAARLDSAGLTVAQQPFAIWQRREDLAAALQALAASLGPAEQIGVTITAELSDAFRSKREGIGFVLDALEQVYPDHDLAVFGVDGRFHHPDNAREQPLLVAAANWMASATLVARSIPDCLLVDIGSTTTDIIPISGGRVAAGGKSDPERLLRGELLYTGALRTTVSAIVQQVPLWGGWCPVSAEHFATIQDVHLLLGTLSAEQCSSATADGRPATAEYAAERLARVVCADGEMLRGNEILAIASCIADAQLNQIADAIRQVCSLQMHPGPVVAAGSGSFLAQAAAARAGLASQTLADKLGVAASEAAPAAAVALLLCDL